MDAPLVLVTGFGPFEKVDRNPSREVAFALQEDPPPGIRIVAGELPVSFVRTGAELQRLIASCAPASPCALLAMGVQKEAYFRLERRARVLPKSGRRDNDGCEGTPLEGPAELVTGLDLDELVASLRRAGATDVAISDDAGQYVCERTYHQVLQRSVELGAGGLFLHIPPVAAVPLDDQIRIVSACVRELVRQARAAT